MKKFIFLLIFYNQVFAAEEHLFGEWNSFNLNGKFGKDSPWIYYGEFGLRTSTFPQTYGNGYDIGAILGRIGFGYQFDKMNSFMIGYLNQYSQIPYASHPIDENRAWQQYQNILNYEEKGKLTNRTRFEQRTLSNNGTTALRLRHQIKYNYPFDKEWGFAVSNELFINCNTVNWGPVEGFDQNRFFIGPSYQFTENFRTEFGYQNVFVNKDLVDDQMSHLFMLSLYYNVPNYDN